MMELVIRPCGNVACIYGEMIDLTAIGSVRVTRASHVEPDRHGQWWADLSPVSGPRLGPFDKRSHALTAESDWLAEHLPSVAVSVARPACNDADHRSSP